MSPAIWARKASRSTVPPPSIVSSIFRSASLRGRLPTWVVRMRESLSFIVTLSRG